jgi:hypothetical protein
LPKRLNGNPALSRGGRIGRARYCTDGKVCHKFDSLFTPSFASRERTL